MDEPQKNYTKRLLAKDYTFYDSNDRIPFYIKTIETGSTLAFAYNGVWMVKGNECKLVPKNPLIMMQMF